MDTKQIELVQASFELVRPMADQAAEIFYRRLLEIAPHYGSLFRHDMRKQGAMLMSTLGLAVGSLNKNLSWSLYGEKRFLCFHHQRLIKYDKCHPNL
jgi:hypothetical protein